MRGVPPGPFHRSLQHRRRLRKDGFVRQVLIPGGAFASDVAARGLDIIDLSHVFNFDVPAGKG